MHYRQPLRLGRGPLPNAGCPTPVAHHGRRRTGRQLDPARQVYDAVLFAHPLHPSVPWPLPPAPCPPPSAGVGTADCGPAQLGGAGDAAVAAGPELGLLSEGPPEAAGSQELLGGTMLRAVSHLAACMPLTASCSPRHRRKKQRDDEEAGRGCSGSGSIEGANGWYPGSGSGGFLHHRRAASDAEGGGSSAGGGQGPIGSSVDGGAGQGFDRSHPWLKSLFARGQ